jgi:hypothetical protein
MARRISPDLLVMLVAALGFTAFGAVTGGTFIVILCGSCLGLILIEVVSTFRRRPAHKH